MPIVGNPAAINNLPASYQGVFADYTAGGTIVAGDVLIFTATGTVTTTTVADNALVAGVATENAVSGEAVNVLTHGVGLVKQTAGASTSGTAIATSTTAGATAAASVLAAGAASKGIVGCQIVTNAGAGLYLCHINVSTVKSIA